MKFSIIVPAYNIDKFINNTINSVINQTYSHWEMIIINDGSTNNSLEILNNIALNEKRIKIINQENMGPLLARENGIKNSSGDYIMFLDADDFYDYNTLEIIRETILIENPDLILFGANKVNVNGDFLHSIKHIYGSNQEVLVLNKEEVLMDFLKTNKLNNVAFKVIKRVVLIKDEDQYYKYGRLIQTEDRLKSLPMIYNSDKIVYIDKKLYNYRTNPSSTSQNYSLKNFIDSLKCETIIEKFLLSNNLDYKYLEASYNQFIYYSLGGYLRLIGSNKKTKEEKREALKLINQSELFRKAKPYLKGKNKYIYKLIKKERMFILDILSIFNKRRIVL